MMNLHLRSKVGVCAVGGMAALVLAACGSDSGSFVPPDPIVRVSVDALGAEGDMGSSDVVVSADGRYVAFRSDATNLVADDINTFGDIFLRDVELGTIARVSLDSAGVEADNGSSSPTVSDDGRYVAFVSNAANLVASDTNGFQDVFLRDTVSGTTTRVSVSSAGTQATGNSSDPAISADGRYVAFMSTAEDMVAGDSNTNFDIFVRDTVAGTTTRVSLTDAGGQSDGNNWLPSISADGRHVSFESDAANLVSGDTNGFRDVYVRDTLAGTTTRVSLSSSGAEPSDFGAYSGTISANGRFVTFESDASNLVSGDTIGSPDLFRRDLVAGTTIRVSLGADGAPGNGSSYNVTPSANGRYVAFYSVADNLVSGDMNTQPDIFVRDTLAGTTVRVSVDSAGAEVDGESRDPVISADGRYVVFWSSATNLVPDDTSIAGDAFRAPNRAYTGP